MFLLQFFGILDLGFFLLQCQKLSIKKSMHYITLEPTELSPFAQFLPAEVSTGCHCTLVWCIVLFISQECTKSLNPTPNGIVSPINLQNTNTFINAFSLFNKDVFNTGIKIVVNNMKI